MPFSVTGRLDDYTMNQYDLRPNQRRFSLTYSTEAGWDDPESPLLEIIKELYVDTALVENVDRYPPIPRHVAPTLGVGFDDEEVRAVRVRSTVQHFLPWIVDDMQKVKWEIEPEISESDRIDPLVVY